MDSPTATEIRAWSPPNYDWAAVGFPDTSPGNAALDVRAGWSVGTLFAVTGRTLASITTVEDIEMAQQCLAAFVLLDAMGGSVEALEVMAAPWLRHFRAGGYDEERFAPKDLGADGSQPPYPPRLWAILLALMTPDQYDEWMFRLTGQRRPAGTFVEVDWGHHEHIGPSIWGPGITHWW